MDTKVDISALVICCPARIILYVDHLTIHMPARPISTMIEPKVIFVMKSGERTIMSSESVRDGYSSEDFKLYRITASLVINSRVCQEIYRKKEAAGRGFLQPP